MTANEDDLAERLRALPASDLDDLAAERVRRRAQAVLKSERALVGRPIARVWSRVVTPVLLVGTCAVYIAWAMNAVGLVYR